MEMVSPPEWNGNGASRTRSRSCAVRAYAFVPFSRIDSSGRWYRVFFSIRNWKYIIDMWEDLEESVVGDKFHDCLWEFGELFSCCWAQRV